MSCLSSNTCFCTDLDCPQALKGSWIWNLQDVRRVLYRLQEILQANPEDSVFIVEGEKDTDRLYEEGLVATTCAMGAVKWDDNYSEFLNDRSRIAIISDNDQSGRRHAKQIAVHNFFFPLFFRLFTNKAILSADSDDADNIGQPLGKTRGSIHKGLGKFINSPNG